MGICPFSLGCPTSACGHTHCCVAIAPYPGELIRLAPLRWTLDLDIEVVQPVAAGGGTDRAQMVYAATICTATGWP